MDRLKIFAYIISTILLICIITTLYQLLKSTNNSSYIRESIINTKVAQDYIIIKNEIPFKGTIIGKIQDLIEKNKHFLISDPYNVSVLKFDNNLNYISRIGDVGSGPGEYRAIHDIASNGDEIFILDSELLQVSIFGMDNEIRSIIPIQRPADHMAVAGDRIFLYGPKNRHYPLIESYSAQTGEKISQFHILEDELKEIMIHIQEKTGGIEIVGNRIYVIHPFDNVVHIYDFDGELTDTIHLDLEYFTSPARVSSPRQPEGIIDSFITTLLHHNGVLFVGYISIRQQSHLLEIFSLDGEKLTPAAIKTDNAPIAVDHNGNIYFIRYPPPATPDDIANPILQIYSMKP